MPCSTWPSPSPPSPPRPVPGTSTRDRLPSTTLFAVGGICLLAGATTRAWPVVAAGLVGASLAALVYGITVERHTQPLHHAVRAALAAGIMALWLQT